MLINQADFFNGFFHGLALRPAATYKTDRDFGIALSAAHHSFTIKAAAAGHSVAFPFDVDNVVGSAPVLKAGLSMACMFGQIDRDGMGKSFKPMVTPEAANAKLETLAGGKELYLGLVADFIENYTGNPTELVVSPVVVQR